MPPATRPELLALHGTLSPDVEALVEHPLTASGAVRATVELAGGPSAPARAARHR